LTAAQQRSGERNRNERPDDMHGVPLGDGMAPCAILRSGKRPALGGGQTRSAWPPSRHGGDSRGMGSPGANAEHRNPPRTVGRVVLSAKSAVETGMSTKMLTGSFVALITPFNRDGSVDFAAFRTLLKFQEDRGTSAVLIMGSTGETSMLAPEEKKAIIVETAKMKTGRMPIFFGCTGNNTDSTIANVSFAKDNGADGAILAAPAYICAPEDDIERFFLDVADATDLPLGIYNNPPRVKSDLHWDHLLRIFKHPNYVVHKESTARVGQVAQVLAGKPNVSVMCCDSPNLGLVVPTMSLGGHGTANMTGNIAPAELATISTPWTSYAEAEGFKNAYLGLLPLLHFTYSAVNPVAVKSLMKAVGLPAGDLRKPLTGLAADALAKGVRIVSELGLDRKYGYKMKPLAAVAA
jgi:4-hydroxy-tetrahydrodipicolinate synthase